MGVSLPEAIAVLDRVQQRQKIRAAPGIVIRVATMEMTPSVDNAITGDRSVFWEEKMDEKVRNYPLGC